MNDLRERLKISPRSLEEINEFLVKPGNPLVDDLVDIVEKHGGVKEINRKASEAGRVETLMDSLEDSNPAFLKDL
ncbi:hypothetical protein KAV47_08165, partial [Candidatus Bathyarchaeota archaeon]|nr:hypothetical protein [Candidatus Bathyarchaeota archaeon]